MESTQTCQLPALNARYKSHTQDKCAVGAEKQSQMYTIPGGPSNYDSFKTALFFHLNFVIILARKKSIISVLGSQTPLTRKTVSKSQ